MVSSRTRIISLNPDLNDPYYHRSIRIYYEMERSFAFAAKREGLEYTVFGGVDIKPPPEFPVAAIPTFSRRMHQSLSPSEWPSLWRQSRTFCDEVLWSLASLSRSAEPPVRNVFFFYHAHPAHIASAIRLGLALEGASPIVLNLYYLHMVYGLYGPSRVPGLREFLSATRNLRRKANVHLRVDSPRLADFIRKDTGEHVEVLPFFSLLKEAAPAEVERASAEPLRLLLPTACPGASKGFDLVVGLAEKMDRRGVEIVVREPGEGALEVCLPTLQAQQGGLRMVGSFLPDDGYVKLMAESDIILIPYRKWHFLSRTSCVVADAVLLGKPMIGTADTWIGDQIENLGAGVTFTDGDIDGFLDAVHRAIDNRENFSRILAERRGQWLQEHNPGSFVRALAECGEEAGHLEGERPPLATFQSSLRRDLGLAHLKSVVSLYLPARSALRRSRRFGRRLTAFRRGSRGRLRCTHFEDLVPGALRKEVDMVPLVRWECQGVGEVELRLDAPDGFTLARGGASGEAWGASWPEEGREVYLQDVTGGKALTSRNTLDSVCYRFGKKVSTDRRQRWKRRWAEAILPSTRFFRKVLKGSSGKIGAKAHGVPAFKYVRASVAWSTLGAQDAEVRIDGPDGKLFAKATSGREETGEWVWPGIGFYLMDTSRRSLPAMLRVLDVARIPPLEAPPYPVSSFSRIARRLLPSGNGAGLTGLAWRPGFAKKSDPESVGDIVDGADTAKAPRGNRNRPSIESVLAQDEWGITPSPTSGEIFLLCSYSKAFLERHGGRRIVVFGPAPYVDVCNLFPNAPVSGRDISEFFVEKHRRLRQRGNSIYLNYGRGVSDGLVGNYTGRNVSFAEIFLGEVGIPLGGPRVKPQVSADIRDAAARRFRKLGLVPGRTAILAPIAGSLIPPPLIAWKRIAEVLRQRGFSVATNAAPGECVLPGTVRLFTPFSEMYAMVEMAGLLVSARSGLCDVCSTAEARMHILLCDHQFVVFPGVVILQRLAENGLDDAAVYHTFMGGEGSLEFAERVLAHQDLQEKTFRSVRIKVNQ